MRPIHEASIYDHGHPDHRFPSFLLPLVPTRSHMCPELPSMLLFPALHSFIAFFVKGQLLFLRHSTLSTHQPCFSCCHASFTHLRLQKACYMPPPAYPTCNSQYYPLVPSISRFTFAHFRFFQLWLCCQYVFYCYSPPFVV